MVRFGKFYYFEDVVHVPIVADEILPDCMHSLCHATISARECLLLEVFKRHLIPPIVDIYQLYYRIIKSQFILLKKDSFMLS